jgi:hypothetical protein
LFRLPAAGSLMNSYSMKQTSLVYPYLVYSSKHGEIGVAQYQFGVSCAPVYWFNTVTHSLTRKSTCNPDWLSSWVHEKQPMAALQEKEKTITQQLMSCMSTEENRSICDHTYYTHEPDSVNIRAGGVQRIPGRILNDGKTHRFFLRDDHFTYGKTNGYVVEVKNKLYTKKDGYTEIYSDVKSTCPVPKQDIIHTLICPGYTDTSTIVFFRYHGREVFSVYEYEHDAKVPDTEKWKLLLLSTSKAYTRVVFHSIAIHDNRSVVVSCSNLPSVYQNVLHNTFSVYLVDISYCIPTVRSDNTYVTSKRDVATAAICSTLQKYSYE